MIISIVVMPQPSAISYFYNNTEISELSVPILTEIELIPKSQTDYYFFSITPPLPEFLQFEASTGVIRGAVLSPLPMTTFVIHGQTTTSVVNKELTLEFVKSVNGTAAGGEVQCDQGSIKVVKKWEWWREMRNRGKVVMEKEISDWHVVGVIDDEEYEVTLTNVKYSNCWGVRGRLLNWMNEEGLMYVYQNNIFGQPAKIDPSFDDVVYKVVSFSVNETALQRPIISSSNVNTTIFAGLNFPSIVISVNQPHFPLSITPALPAGIRLIPRTDGTPGYWITGVFETDGIFDIMITAKNPRGTDSLKLHLVVEGKFIVHV